MAQIGHLQKCHSTTIIALATAWANLLGISLLSSTPTASPSFIRSQHRKLAALLHPDKNHYKDASLRFTQLQQGVETVSEHLSSSSTTTCGDASQSSYQHCYDTNDYDGQELDDSWVNASDGGNFPWWSRWDDDDSEEEEEEEEGFEGEGEQQEEEDVSYLKSLTHEELKQEVAKRREGVLFHNSKTMHSRLARGRAVLTNALHEQTAKEFEQQPYGGFFPAF
jgi:DnaJ-class molecular chaperone